VELTTKINVKIIDTIIAKTTVKMLSTKCNTQIEIKKVSSFICFSSDLLIIMFKRCIAVISWVASRTLSDAGHVIRMMISTSNYARATRRAQSSSMHIAVSKTIHSQTVQIGCFDRAAHSTQAVQIQCCPAQ